jgi:hypothetical protein
MDKPAADAPSSSQPPGAERSDQGTNVQQALAAPEPAPNGHTRLSDSSAADDGELFEAGYGHGV